MAEVVGLVIGVVSLGVQLAESVQKMKRFYNTVKDAPERLTDIIDEIESLSDILTEMEGDHTAYTTEPGPKMQRCVATCRQAVDKFSTYADSLESRMKRHSRRGSVKFAMKSESIEGVIARLESSKSNLVLAYMLYREAVADKRAIHMQQQMETMAVAQTLLLQQPPQPSVVLATPNAARNHPQSTPALRRKNVVRLSSPTWLSQSVWELAIERAISGWTFSLRSYRIVPFESPVTQACLRNDVALLQQLFSRREASPFDQTQNSTDLPGGDSLLSTAVLFCKPEVARFLITTTGELLGITAFDVEYSWGRWSIWANEMSDTKALQRHFSLLLEHCDSDELESSLDNVRTFAYGNAEHANLVLFWNEILQVSQHRSATNRELMWSTLLEALILDDEIEYLVGHRAIDYLDHECIELNSAAHLLTMAFIASTVSSAELGMSNARVLSKLVAEARHYGIDPLVRERTAISPMLRLLHPEPANSALATHSGWKDLSAILTAWISLLEQLGVDLAEYGEEEWRIFQLVRRKYECKRPWDSWRGTMPHSCYEYSGYLTDPDFDEPNAEDLDGRPTLFSFSYGAAVSDWKLWEVHPGDQYAGHFWGMIEQIGFPPEGDGFCGQEMPGSWLDD